MATLNWDDIREVSTEEAEESLLETLQTAGFKATSWQPFSMGLTLVKIGAVVWHEGSKIAVAFKNAVFNSTSSGTALTLFSDSHYDNQREDAVAATRLTTLTCETGEGPHTIDVGEVVVSDDNGITFRNVEGNSVSYPFVLGSGTSQQFLFEAEEAGEVGNVPDGDVTTIVTTLTGVTITDDELDTEGVDEEADTRLQERNATKWPTLNPLELIDDHVVNWVLGASPTIAVARVNSNNPRGAGTFDVYISGLVQSSSDDDVEAAQTILDRKVFGQQTALVIAAEEVELSLSGEVFYVSSVGATAARQAVEDALDAYLLTIPLGGFDYAPGLTEAVPVEDIEEVIKTALASGARCVKAVDLDPFDPSDGAGNFPVGNFRKVVRGNWNSLTFTPVTGKDG
jgi:hypothetical protein